MIICDPDFDPTNPLGPKKPDGSIIKTLIKILTGGK